LNPIPPLPPLPSSFPVISASVTLSRSSSDPHPHGPRVYGDATSRLKTKSDTHLPLSVSNFLALEEDAESMVLPVPSSSQLSRKDSIKRNSPPSHAIRVPESPGSGRWSSFGSELESSIPSLRMKMGMTWKEAMERRELGEWEEEEDPTPMPSPTTPTLGSFFSGSAAQSRGQGMVETAPLRISSKGAAQKRRCGTPMSGWLGSGRGGQNGLHARTMSSRVNLPRTEVYYAEAPELEKRSTVVSQRSRNDSANSEADSTYWTAKSCLHEE